MLRENEFHANQKKSDFMKEEDLFPRSSGLVSKLTQESFELWLIGKFQ
jgi:hypothetical protein